MTKKIKTLFGLPEQVVFCRRCVMSNQRPCSYPEFKHAPSRITPTLHIDEEGICDACRFIERKEDIDWAAREKEMVRLLDKHRRRDGKYDCILPGSGGKDSAMASHLLKYKYGMHPLTVTWPPLLYTDYGRKNFLNWIEIGGFDNITCKPNGRVQRLLTRLAIKNLLHPFQTFILGQKNIAAKIAARFNIPLVFYGENEAEYGNPIADNESSLRDNSFHIMRNLKELWLGGVPILKLLDTYNLNLNDISPYLPLDYREFETHKIEVHYLGYYIKWDPQEAYRYAVKHTGLQARPFRTEGTYTTYNSLDDKIDDLHYYTTFIKFGLGRASYDAAQEIRNKRLDRSKAVKLVHKFDGEFPERYFDQLMDYLELTPDYFLRLCDRFRSPHLWEKKGGEWKLKHRVE